MGAFNLGLFLDQGYDFGHLARYHFWAFGISGNLFSEAFADGQTVAAEFGFLNGMQIDDMTVLMGILHFNTSASGGGFHINKLASDQAQIKVDAAEWLQIDTVYIVRGLPATSVHSNINVSGGVVQIGNIYTTSNVAYPHIDVTGGSVAIYGGRLGDAFVYPGAPLARVT